MVCLLVWKMFVKKREFGGGREEERGRGMQMRLGSEKGLRSTKAFIVRSLLRYSCYQPTMRRIE